MIESPTAKSDTFLRVLLLALFRIPAKPRRMIYLERLGTVEERLTLKLPPTGIAVPRVTSGVWI
jgi:hypothetical protein